MKKLKILSFATILFLVGCNTTKVSEENNEESQIVETSQEAYSSENTSKSSSKSSSSSSSQTQTNIPAATYSWQASDLAISQQKENCKNYVDAMRNQQKSIHNDYYYSPNYVINQTTSVDIANYYDAANTPKAQKADHSYGVKISLPSSVATVTSEKATVEYSMNSNFTESMSISVNKTDTEVTLVNLFSAKTYYWRVKDGNNVVSEVSNFTTGDYPRWIDCGAMYNVRDMGGYMTSSGKRVKQGLVFRGGEITHKAWATDHTFTGDDAAKDVFRNVMKIGVELDLRRTADLGGGETYTSCMFAENGDIDYVNKQINSFSNGVNNNASLIKDCFNLFANADRKPVYYHCHGGADRTGTLGFILLGLLGVSYTDCVIDYELTSYSSIGGGDCKRSHLRSGQYNDFPGFMNTMRNMKVNNQNIWDDNKSLSENCEAYLTKKAGVSQANINKIKQIMIED